VIGPIKTIIYKKDILKTSIFLTQSYVLLFSESTLVSCRIFTKNKFLKTSLNFFLNPKSAVLLISESTLVSGSLDMTVRIWDLRSGQQIR
jgi:hypothetical protein